MTTRRIHRQKQVSPLASELAQFAARPSLATKAATRKNVTAQKEKPITESAASSLFTSDLITLLFWSLKIMPDPDEVLRKAGLNRAALRKLAYDDEISQAIETRRDAAVNTPWRLEGGNDTANAFIADQITKFQDLLFPAMWNARIYGYSVTQIVFAELGTQIGIAWVGEMPFEYYFPQRDGTILYRPQGAGEPIPLLPQKYIVPIVNPTYMNPYGEALLSRLYWLWFFRTHGWQYWVQWLEQFGAPFLHGKTANVVDPQTGVKSVDALAAMLDKTRRGSSVATDPNTTIEVVEAKGSTNGQQFKFFDDAVSRQISKVVLGQTLTSSEGQHGGNRALGQIHEEVRQDKRRADVKILVKGGQHLVNSLWELNGLPGTPAVFTMEDEKGLQKDRADRDAAMVDKGVLIFTRPYLKDHYDLADEDFIAPGEPGFAESRGAVAQTLPGDNGNDAANVPQPKGAPKQPAAAPPKSKKQTSFASFFARDGAQFTPEQEVIERGITELVDSMPNGVLSSAMIKEAIMAAKDPNDLATKLAVACQGADLNQFRIVLEKALYAAEVIGYVQATERVTPPSELA